MHHHKTLKSTKTLTRQKRAGEKNSNGTTYLIRNKLVDLIENTFRREEVLYLTCYEEGAFFASE